MHIIKNASVYKCTSLKTRLYISAWFRVRGTLLDTVLRQVRKREDERDRLRKTLEAKAERAEATRSAKKSRSGLLRKLHLQIIKNI